MSTHRQRNQMRQQQAGGTQQSQQIINSPMTPPKTFGKSVIIPVIIDIVVCIAICVARSVINKNTELHLPFRIVPLTIVAAVLIAIYIVVSYIIKQYKYLKNTYQMLEQGMTIAAELNAHQGDFVEYSLNSPYYNNGMQYNQNQQYNHNQQSVTGNAAVKAKSNAGCGITLISIILVTAVMGLFVYMLLPENFSIFDCTFTSGIVTDVRKNVTETEEETYINYIVDYKYDYDGKTFTGTDSIKLAVHKGDDVDVVVDSTDPQRSFLAVKVTYLLMIWGGIVLVLILIGAVIGSRSRRRR